MADISIAYSVSPTACAGGGHYSLTALIKGLGPDRVVDIDVPDLDREPTPKEVKDALGVITWLLAKKYLSSRTHSQAQALLHNRQIVLDPQVIP